MVACILFFTLQTSAYHTSFSYCIEDDGYTITYPDLPGCISEGKTLGNAMYMVQFALTQWIGYLADKKLKIPSASPAQKIKTSRGDFVNLICAEVKATRAVKRTVGIPK